MRMQRLIAENEIIGKHEVVPGLEPKVVSPVNATRPVEVACIGDMEVLDPRNHVDLCLPANPALVLPMSIELSEFDVFLPDRANLERKLMSSVAKSMFDYDRVDATILSRTLKVGLHNGHGVIGGNFTDYNLGEDEEDENILIVPDDFQVRGYAPHELLAMVFLVEYEVGIPFRQDAKVNKKAMHNTFTSIREENMITKVVLGCAVHTPFDGKRVVTSTSMGPKGMVQCLLWNDDTCAIMTPHPVFVDPSTEAKSGGAGDAKEDSDAEDDAMGHMNICFAMKVQDPVSIPSDRADAGSMVDGEGDGGDDDHRADRKYVDRDSDSEIGETRHSHTARRTTDRDRDSATPKDNFRRPGGGYDRPSRGATPAAASAYDDDDELPPKLDATHYEARRERGPYELETSMDAAEMSSAGASPPRPRGGTAVAGPRGEPSLYSRALTAPIVPGGRPEMDFRRSQDGGYGGPGVVDGGFDRYDGAGRRLGVPQTALTNTTAGGTREISRGARARLDRFGFNDAMLTDDAGPTGQSGGFRSEVLNTKGSIGGKGRVDLNLEVSDHHQVNDITIQFAAFRHGKFGTESAPTIRRPSCIYFSYQFYSSAPTRTELLKLLSPDEGRLCVLARDDSFHRNEPPLALRHVVDGTAGNAIESLEFAEYLAHKVLYVDVWDSDSLIQLGTCAVPLRDLLRQGNSSVKRAIECDVVAVDLSGANTAGGGGGSVIYSGGMLHGDVVGSVQIILANHGKRGSGVARDRDESKSGDPAHVGAAADLNWRINPSNDNASSSLGRPRHSTRARPLSERAPELSDAIVKHRAYSHRDEAARSMSASRGSENANTITYEEIMTLFKKFAGSVTGTVRYNAELMTLLEVPSLKHLISKILSAYNAEPGVFEDEMYRVASGSEKDATMALVDFQDAIMSFFERCGAKVRPEEATILAKHIEKNSTADGSRDIRVDRVIDFLKSEANRRAWASTGKRFRQAVQDGYLIGYDIEQALSERDTHAKDVISVTDFREVLKSLSKLSTLSARDINQVSDHFTAKAGKGKSAVVPLKDVMMFIGRSYVGNLEARLANFLSERYSKADLLTALGKLKMTPAELEAKLGTFGVFEELDHEQVRTVLKRAIKDDASGVLDAHRFLAHIKMDNAGEESVETLLKAIMELVQAKGVAIDEAFRHFDRDGDGCISPSEFEIGLSQLEGFEKIPNWRAQIPNLVNKFDKNNDGHVQLRDFFLYFGVTSYAPNVIQRLTKIFLIAHEKGLSFKDIFQEFDSNGDGLLTASELVAALEALSTFEPVTIEDAGEVIAHLHPDKSEAKEINRKEFESFFESRLAENKQSKEDSKKRREEKAKSAAAAAASTVSGKEKLSAAFVSIDKRIKALLRRAIAQNLSIDELFSRGDLKLSEMRAVLDAMSAKHDGDLTGDEIASFVQDMDVDHSGTISQATFRAVVDVKEGEDHVVGPADTPELLTFRRELRRIARPYEGVTAMVATLDKEGSGSVSIISFVRFLEEEGLFSGKRSTRATSEGKHDDLDTDREGDAKASSNEPMSKSDVEKVLDPVTYGGKVNLANLMQLIEGKPISRVRVDEDEEEEGDTVAVEAMRALDYTFDKDPFINALEKKLRRIGRIVGKRGVHIESMFTQLDRSKSGLVRRTEFIEILSKLGLSILEGDEGAFDGLRNPSQLKAQMHQVNKIKGQSYASNAGKYARSSTASNDGRGGDPTFDDHLESMALINWYRQSQKKNMLQRVLSQSLVCSVDIHPRFGKTVFFEQPFTNPFAYEERFVIELNDPELRLVTNFDEWLHLRAVTHALGSGTGNKLGPEPVEPDMFDKDSYGNIQVALLPHETLYLPFTFMTLVPHHKTVTLAGGAPHPGAGESKEDGASAAAGRRATRPHRVASINIVSGTRGHSASIIHVNIYPSPFIVNRTLRFLESENSMMKRRIQFVDSGAKSGFDAPDKPVKYVHCVDHDGRASQDNLVVEWAPSAQGSGNLDMVLRYRCGTFPQFGSFYILLYDDQYHCSLHELWHVMIQFRQRLDVHGPIGSNSIVDLVVRGDNFPRRARAFVSGTTDNVSIAPNAGFQLTPGAYNRIAVKFVPKSLGTRKLQLNLVDTDSRELISAWLLTTTATAPAVMRSYNVEVGAGKVVNKKIMFKNPWDGSRRFALSSSNKEVMRVRVEHVDVGPHSDCYLRLLFDGKGKRGGGVTEDVFLFLNDEYSGENEECFMFRVTFM